MAEVALYMRDPERGYEIGDVICVMPDGSDWGTNGGLDDALMVRVPGLSVEDAQWFAYPLLLHPESGLYFHDLGMIAPAIAEQEAHGIPLFLTEVARRRYQIDINSTMAGSGIDPDAFGLVYVENWLVYDVNPVWIDKAAL